MGAAGGGAFVAAGGADAEAVASGAGADFPPQPVKVEAKKAIAKTNRKDVVRRSMCGDSFLPKTW